MNAAPTHRRVVITGLGVISPLGSSPAALWAALAAGQSGVAATSLLPPARQPLKFAGECRQFTGEIDDFGPLEKERKKAIKKGLKVMCRETRMAVAAAQLAIADAGFAEVPMPPELSGVVLAFSMSTPSTRRSTRSSGRHRGAMVVVAVALVSGDGSMTVS